MQNSHTKYNILLALILAIGALGFSLPKELLGGSLKLSLEIVASVYTALQLFLKAAPKVGKKLNIWLRSKGVLEIFLPWKDADSQPPPPGPGINQEKFLINFYAYTKRQIADRLDAISGSKIFIKDFGIQPSFSNDEGLSYNRDGNWRENYKLQFAFITGESGSGKSFELIKRAKFACDGLNPDPKELNEQIPVYIELKSLDDDFDLEWIVEYINKSAKSLKMPSFLPRDITAMINSNHVIFFLDGLDEVKEPYQQQCINKVFEYGNDIGVQVSCRKKMYDDVISKKIRETNLWPGEYFLGPLSKEEIFAIIPGLGRTPEETAEVTRFIGNKRNLLENLSRPIILTLFLTSYFRLPQETKTKLEESDEEATLNILWENYEVFIFKERLPKDADMLIMRSYLVWMAKVMGKQAFYVQSIQPNWLEKVNASGEVCADETMQRLYYLITRIMAALIIGIALSCIISFPFAFVPNSILGGVVVSLIAGIYKKTGFEVNRQFSRLSFSMLMIVILVICCGIYQGFSVPRAKEPIAIPGFAFPETWPGVLLGIVLSTILSYRIILEKEKKQYILPVERFHFDWPHAIRYGVLWGAVSGVIVGILAAIVATKDPENLFLTDWLKPFLIKVAGNIRVSNLAGIWLYLAAFAYGFFICFIVASLLIITLAGRYNDPEADPETQRTNYGINQSLWQAFVHAFWSALVGASIYLVMALVFRMGDFRHGVWITIGIAVLAFLWFGGMEGINHGLLRILLYIKGIAPFYYRPWAESNAGMGLFTPSGYKMSFYHPTLATYYANYSLKDSRRVRVKEKTLVGPFCWIVTILLLSLLSTPFVLRYGLGIYWKNHYSGVILKSPFVKKSNDSIYAVERSGNLKFKATGVIDVGTLIGYVRPKGTGYGFIGMPLKGAYNLPGLDAFLHSALLFKVRKRSKGWSKYAYVASSDSLWVEKGDSLAFIVNDKEWQNNWGQYIVELKFCDTCKH